MGQESIERVLVGLQPFGTLLLMTTTAVVLGMAVAPPTDTAQLWIAHFSEYTTSERAEFKSQVLIWAAVGVVVVMSLWAALAVSVMTIIRHVPRTRPGLRTLLIAGPLGFGTAVLAIDRIYASDIAAPLQALHNGGFVEWPLAWFTALANAQTAWAIASLFAGATAIVITDHDDFDELSGKLKTLLTVGTVATVAGVVEINALHRLPAAAARGTVDWKSERAFFEDALADRLDEPFRSNLDSDLPESHLVEGWIERDLHVEHEAARDALIPEFLRAMQSDPAIQAAIVQSWLRESDSAARASARTAQESIASHTASFWGLVFTAALAFLYIPPAVVLVSRQQDKQTAARSLAVGMSVSAPTTAWEDVVKPFVRLLATLAPLLVGVLADFLRSSSDVLTP